MRHPALFQPVKLVAVSHCARPVRNNQDGLPAMQGIDGPHDLLLGGRIQGAGCLIQHQHSRVVIKGPGNPDALALTTGKPDAPLANHGIDAVRQAGDKFLQLSSL